MLDLSTHRHVLVVAVTTVHGPFLFLLVLLYLLSLSCTFWLVFLGGLKSINLVAQRVCYFLIGFIILFLRLGLLLLSRLGANCARNLHFCLLCQLLFFSFFSFLLFTLWL